MNRAKESEETEVKSKQELIEEWESAIEAAELYGKGKEERLISYMKDFVSDLKQLDEPEVLSDKWIDDNSVYASADGVTEEYVHVDVLKEVVVPKQELPVIPKFAAEWIEKYIEYGYDLYPALKKMENNARSWERIYDWYRKNTHTFVNAYLTGKYEVEEEQKYYVLDKEGHLLIRGFSNGSVGRVGERMKPDIYPDWNKKNLPLTEQEIKGYDERYWPFAVKVEEMEE